MKKRRPEYLLLYEAEVRVLRACKTVRAVPDSERKWLRGEAIRGSMPIPVQEHVEAYGSEIEQWKFHPTPRDVSDMLTALGWCRVLEKEEFRFIWWRSFDLSFGVMACRIHRSDETARARYKDALIKVWAEANRQAEIAA